MAWLFLFIAIIFETTWPFLLKLTKGFTKLLPSIGTLACTTIDIVFLSFALKTLPVSMTYAVWTGSAIVGTNIIGMVFLHEPSGLLKIACVILILTGVIGLRLLNPPSP